MSAQPVDVLAVMDRAEVDLREVADHYCAEPIMADELREARAAVAELIEAARPLLSELRALEGKKSIPKMTGPVLRMLERDLRAALARVGGAK